MAAAEQARARTAARLTQMEGAVAGAPPSTTQQLPRPGGGEIGEIEISRPAVTRQYALVPNPFDPLLKFTEKKSVKHPAVRGYPSSFTTMEDEVAAVVVDNGSGMVKVRSLGSCMLLSSYPIGAGRCR